MCVKCKYENYLDEIEEMLDDVDFEFALDTLCGIKSWVGKHSHITEKQIEAIENIKECKGRFED